MVESIGSLNHPSVLNAGVGRRYVSKPSRSRSACSLRALPSVKNPLYGTRPTIGNQKPDWSISDLHMGCPLLRGVEQQTSNRERDTWLTGRLKEQNALTKETRKKAEERQAAAKAVAQTPKKNV